MPDEPRPKHPMEKFTIAGRLLIVATIVVACGLFYWNVMYIHDYFPAGSYPLPFVLIAVLIGTAIFYGAVYFFLRLLGIKVVKDSERDKTG